MVVSGGKAIRGPQSAGILAGRADLITGRSEKHLAELRHDRTIVQGQQGRNGRDDGRSRVASKRGLREHLSWLEFARPSRFEARRSNCLEWKPRSSFLRSRINVRMFAYDGIHHNIPCRRTPCCRRCATANPPWSLSRSDDSRYDRDRQLDAAARRSGYHQSSNSEKFSQEEFEREMHFLRRKLFMALGALPFQPRPPRVIQRAERKRSTTGARSRAATPLYSEIISYGDLVFVSGHGTEQSGWNQRANRIRP